MSVLSAPFKPSWHTQRLRPEWDWVRRHALAAYPLWERGGKRVYNQHRPNRDAGVTYGAGEGWIDSNNGPALHFAGSGYINLGVGRIEPFGLFAGPNEAWTVCVRVRAAQFAAGSIMSRLGSGVLANQTFDLRFNRTNQVQQTPFVRLRGTSTATNWGIDDGEFHVAWVTWNGLVGKAYYDAAQGEVTLGVGTAVEEAATATIMVGAQQASGPSNFLTGDINFFALLDIPLSPAEIVRWQRDLLGPWRPYERRTYARVAATAPVPVAGEVVDRNWALELWSDVSVNGGIRIASVPMAEGPIERAALSGEHSITFKIPLDHPAVRTIDTPADVENFRINQVVRLITPGIGVGYSEHRIAESSRRVGLGRYRQIVAESIREDLVTHGIISRTYPDGRSTTRFLAAGLTINEHLDQYFLPALAESGQPFWKIGFVVDDDPVDVQYDNDTTESGLRKLAEAAGDYESFITWDEGGYYINIVKQIGAGTQPLDVYAPRNMLDLAFIERGDDQANRIVPVGQTVEEVQATCGQAEWLIMSQVAHASTHTVDLYLSDPAGGDPPIGFDGQFLPYDTPATDEDDSVEGFTSPHYIEMVTGGNWVRPIVDTKATGPTFIADGATQRTSIVTVSSDTLAPYPLTGRPRIKIAANASGREILFVDHPAMVKAFGVRVGQLEREDIPPTVNQVFNPILRVWPSTSSLPTGWQPDDGTSTDDISWQRESDPRYWEYGGHSLRVSVRDQNSAIWAPAVSPPVDQGLVSFFVRVIVLEGAVRPQLWFVRPAGQPGWQYPGSTAPNYAYPTSLMVGETARPDIVSQQFQVPEEVGKENVWDLSKYPLLGGYMRIAIRPDRNAPHTEYIVLAAQITYTMKQMPLIDGTGGVRLWQAANRRLKMYGAPSKTISTNLIDLARINGLKFPYEQVTLGGAIRVTDQDSGIFATTRVVGYTRDWQKEAMPSVELSQERMNVAAFLTSRRWTARQRPQEIVEALRGQTYEP